MSFRPIIDGQGYLIYLILISFAGFAQPAENWKLQKQRDGISIYSGFSEGSKYKSIRAVTEFQCELPDILALMKDVESHDEWVSHCMEAISLESSGDTSIVLYEYYDLPWPASDRDIIIEYNIRYDPTENMAWIRQEGRPDFLPVKSNMIRIPEYRGSWRLVGQSDGKVYGEYTALVEPGGFVPAWIVNIFAGKGPYDTIVNLKRAVEKVSY
jgi:hypothetical protein